MNAAQLQNGGVWGTGFCTIIKIQVAMINNLIISAIYHIVNF
jgi:hypothetical protein